MFQNRQVILPTTSSEWPRSPHPNEGCRWLWRILQDAKAESNGLTASQSGRTSKMARLEAVLFVSDSALSARRIMQLATLADATEVRSLIDQLNAALDAGNSSFRIERVASGYRMLTRPEFAFWLDKLHNRQTAMKLSPPAMETLTVVAYRQPVTRADVEAVRGVQSSEILKQLMDRGLVRTAGTEDSLGRPFLYATTSKFLEMFGLKSLDDMPMADRLRGPVKKQQDDEDQSEDEEVLEESEATSESDDEIDLDEDDCDDEDFEEDEDDYDEEEFDGDEELESEAA